MLLVSYQYIVKCPRLLAYNVIFLGSWPACLHTSGPEGFHKSDDCRAQKFFVCQNDAEFSSPPQGGGFISKYVYVQMSLHISGYLGIFYLPIHNILESYIHSPDYLNSYPHDYEQVNMV